jgi:trimethylamine--corrinoid protein Co-methyltransferase
MGSIRNRLRDDQLDLLNKASLEIMDRTGMRFFRQEAIDLFKKAGADISDGNLVRIPPQLTEWALRTVPKEIVIYDRNGKPAMSFDKGRCYFGVGSDCLHIYDPYTRKRRQAVLEDVRRGVRLVDALPHLDFVMSMFMPADVAVETYERYQMQAMLQESTKPVIFCGVAADSTRSAVEMSSEVAGGPDFLQRFPFIINYINTISPFRHNEESVRRLLFAAERNLPTIYAPGNCRGTTAPMTVAGMMALGYAGQLAGLVLSQLKREGSPFILNHPNVGAMDMRSMRDLYVAPDKASFGCQLAHNYQLPILGSGGCSDSKVFDTQAAAEAALTLFASITGGADLIHCIGYLDSAMTGSLELMVLCDEIIGWLKRYLREIEVSEETLALELIHKIGPDRDFLQTEHTLKHFREDWFPTVFSRTSYEQWAEEGMITLEQRLNEKVRDILENHHADPLPDDINRTIAGLVDEAPGHR